VRPRTLGCGLATTSAGVAWSLGFGDGGHLDRQRALEVIARMVASVGLPVTADIEGGFAAAGRPLSCEYVQVARKALMIAVASSSRPMGQPQ
jgi:2-methylisocitrate lyase-like PEP mutase family enzyme